MHLVDTGPSCRRKAKDRKWKVEKIALPSFIEEYLSDALNIAPDADSRGNGSRQAPTALPTHLVARFHDTYFPLGHTFSLVVDRQRRLLRIHSAAVECTVGTVLAVIQRNHVGQKGTANPHPFVLCPCYEAALQAFLNKQAPDRAPNTAQSSATTGGAVTGCDELPPSRRAKFSALCAQGARCEGLHIALEVVDGALSLPASQVHHNYIHRRGDDPLPMDEGYERFDTGTVVPLAEPNCRGPTSLVDSGSMLVTHGAKQFLQGHMDEPTIETDSDSDSVPTRRKEQNRPDADQPHQLQLQHCAHFKKHGVCFLGPTCKFVHVIGTTTPASSGPPSLAGTPPQPLGPDVRWSAPMLPFGLQGYPMPPPPYALGLQPHGVPCFLVSGPVVPVASLQGVPQGVHALPYTGLMPSAAGSFVFLPTAPGVGPVQGSSPPHM